MIDQIVSSLKLKIAPRDARSTDYRVQLFAVCSAWLPMAASVLGKFFNLTVLLFILLISTTNVLESIAIALACERCYNKTLCLQ